MSDVFDPYYQWLGIPPEEQPPDHYRLLGLSRFEDDADAIREAVLDATTLVRKHALGPHSELSQQLLNEIHHASAVLQSADRRSRYDEALRGPPRKPGRTEPARPEPIRPSSVMEPLNFPAASQAIPEAISGPPPSALPPPSPPRRRSEPQPPIRASEVEPDAQQIEISFGGLFSKTWHWQALIGVVGLLLAVMGILIVEAMNRPPAEEQVVERPPVNPTRSATPTRIRFADTPPVQVEAGQPTTIPIETEPSNGVRLTLAPRGHQFAQIDSTTGDITWSGAPPGRYSVQIDAVLEANPAVRMTHSVHVVVTSQRPELAGGSPPDATPGQLWMWDLPLKTPLDPRHVDASQSNLPPGMVLDMNAGRMLWANPHSTSGGTVLFQVRLMARNNDWPPVEQTYRLNIAAPNQPPVLSRRTYLSSTSPGNSQSISFSARDPDGPSQDLRFSLARPIAGCSIDATTGQVSWEVPLGLQGTSQTISVVVTDQGTPPRSDQEDLTISVRALSPVRSSRQLSADGQPVLSLAYSLRTPWTVIGGAQNGQLFLWRDYSSLSPTTRDINTTPIIGLAISPDSSLALSGDDIGRLELSSYDGTTIDSHRLPGAIRSIHSTARSTASSDLAAQARQIIGILLADGSAYLYPWNGSLRDPILLSDDLKASHMAVDSVAQIVARIGDGSMRIDDLVKKETYRASDDRIPLTGPVAIRSAPGFQVATARANGEVWLHDAPDLTSEPIKLPPTRGQVTQLAYSPDGECVIVVTDAGIMGFYCPVTGYSIDAVDLGSQIVATAFRPDGSRLAVALSNRNILLLSLPW
jgi:hypothetical protein